VLVRAKEKRGVERTGEIHGAVHSGEQWPNSSEPLRRREGLPPSTDASSGCEMAKRCSWRGERAGGELERPESPTPARAHGGGGEGATAMCVGDRRDVRAPWRECGCGEWSWGSDQV
jgi:hypothetical protein